MSSSSRAGGPIDPGGAPPRPSRDELARAALEPLREDERPAALLVAIAVAVLLALGVIIGALTVHGLSHHGGSLPGGVFLACVLVLLAGGMYRRRYWAVLGFEALLAFQILVTSLALVVASTLLAAGLCVVSIGLAGWLFWKLIRVMGRIQAHGPG
jgi:multisubunit Na+/H+ antiporter MnhB subunit